MIRAFIITFFCAQFTLITQSQDLYLVSLRHEVTDPLQLASESQVFKFPTKLIEDSSSTLLSGDSGFLIPSSQEILFEELTERRVLVIIHGMAKSFTQANKDLINVYYNARELDFYEAFVAITWPGDQYLGLDPFFNANKNARRSGRMAGDFLEQLSLRTLETDVLTHSMGSKVVAKAFKSSDFECTRAFLLAPSILRNTMRPFRRWRSFPSHVSGNIVLFYSKEDWAFSYTSMQHRGMGYKGARIRKSSRIFEDFIQVDCTNIINQEIYKSIPRTIFTSRSNHSYYTHAPEVYAVVRSVLMGNVHSSAIKLK